MSGWEAIEPLPLSLHVSSTLVLGCFLAEELGSTDSRIQMKPENKLSLQNLNIILNGAYHPVEPILRH